MRRVLAIFLDGYDHALGQRLMASGGLPEMAKLAASSARFLLDHGSAQRTGLAGEHIATGLSPDAAQRWSAVHFDPRTYAAWLEGTKLRPFPADLTARTVVFDPTYFDLHAASAVRGVVGWGAHDPGARPSARPASLCSELNARFGDYPAQEWIYGFVWPSASNAAAMGRDLAHAVDVRTRAACWLLGERLPDWDLALVTVSELHSATEGLWHGIDPNHPLHHTRGAGAAATGMHAVYQAVDRLLGSLAAAFPEALTIVFAMGGMGENRSDVPSMLLLPELFYRHAFGRAFFRQPEAWRWSDDGSPVPLTEDERWEGRIAAEFPPPTEPRLRRLATRVLPRPVKTAVHRILARAEKVGGEELALRQPLSWMPATAYQPFWPTMQAFALPSFYDGRVRLNLIGRERRGVIQPDEYPQALERMERLVRDCTDPATGESIVDVVEYQAPRNPRAATQTQADLVFVWKGALACFDHPTLGRIGPVPYRRPGGHTGLAGMAFVHGAERVGDFGTRSSFDVVPTIIDMMGLPPQRSLSGTSLLTHA